MSKIVTDENDDAERLNEPLGRELPFELEVLVDTRPYLRGGDMEAYIGRGVLELLFDHMEETDVTHLSLPFPERWLNILEQRALVRRIQLYCPRMEKVTIVTHSVHIVQSAPNGCCKILQEEEEPINEGDMGKLYSGPKAYFLGPGLNVLGGRRVEEKR